MPEKIEFSKGGDGDGPKGFFKSVSSFSSVVCRPDPENPGRQICKRVEQSDTYDPFNGGSESRKRESEEYREAPTISNLFGFRQ
jgi:hypothetical protein